MSSSILPAAAAAAAAAATTTTPVAIGASKPAPAPAPAGAGKRRDPVSRRLALATDALAVADLLLGMNRSVAACDAGKGRT